MKTTSLVAVFPLASRVGPRRLALTLAVIVTLIAALAAPRARAEDKPAGVAEPESVQPPAGTATELPPVNHLVYLEKLPTTAALIREAKAQGATIQRIDRTGDSVVVTCKYPDGRTDSTGYSTLAAASTVDEPEVTAPASTPPPKTDPTVVAGPAAPRYTVIYSDPAPVYYETRYYRDYDPFWAPLALGIGIGWVTGGHGHGGWGHGHHGWRH